MMAFPPDRDPKEVCLGTFAIHSPSTWDRPWNRKTATVPTPTGAHIFSVNYLATTDLVTTTTLVSSLHCFIDSFKSKE